MTEKAPALTSPELSKDPYERFHNSEREDKYTILRGDKQEIRGKVNVWDTAFTQGRYLEATDRLLGILDGSITSHEITDTRDPERAAENPDVVLYLDKSARPVEWFVDAFWDTDMVKDIDSDIPEAGKPNKPDSEFLNIDRTFWFMRQGHDERNAESSLGPKDFDIDQVPDSDIARIRAIFIDGEIDESNWEEDVWNHPTRLDGKNMLIVDEVKNRGGTLAIATQLLRRAIPELAAVNGDYFWKAGRYALGGDSSNMQMESAPVWYSKEDPWGRGVGDLSKAYYEQLPNTPENVKRKLGWIALSAPHHNPVTFEEITDSRAEALKQDIVQLKEDLLDGSVFAMPSLDRDTGEVIEMLAKRYPGMEVSDLTKYRNERYKQNKY